MSKRTSGVKNFVSNIGDFSREVPFIQPTYPTLAHGVWVSFSGPGSGSWSASAIFGAAATPLAEASADAGAGPGTGATAGAVGDEGAFITRSRRVALLPTTSRAATMTSG